MPTAWSATPAGSCPGEEGYPYIQTTVPLSHGSSGGPLLDARGQVIGIATAGLSEGDSLNLAVPISCLADVDLTGPGESFDAYYQRLADQCRLTVSPAAATVPAGGEVVLRAAHNLPGEWGAVRPGGGCVHLLPPVDGQRGERRGLHPVPGRPPAGGDHRHPHRHRDERRHHPDGAGAHHRHRRPGGRLRRLPTVPDPARLWARAPAGRSDSGALLYDGAALAAAAGENYFAAYRQKLEQAGFFLTGYGVDAGTGAPLLLLDNADTGQRVSLA